MIKLSSGELRVKKIIKPTKAKFFEDIKEGDSIEIFHLLQSTTGGANGLYASDFMVKNYTRNSKKYISGNNLVLRLSCFELEIL